MENASKALIIAGAILISIILISIGIMVVSSSQGLTGQATETMNAQEIEAFNSQFTGFEGVQKGSQVKTLMTRIASSNASRDEDHQVTVKGPNNETTTDAIRSAVRATSNYTITFESDPTTALIKSVTITAGSGSTNTTH